MSKRLKYLFTLAIPLAVAGLGGAWLLDRQKPKAATLVHDTAPLERGQIRKLVATSGPVRALVTVSVGTQISGQLRELKVDFNSEVKGEEILAVIDDKTYVARVAQARADLAMATAQLVNAEASLRKSDAIMKQAERVSTRQQTLATKGIAAAVSVDTATRDFDVAKADIAVAKAQIESAKAQIAQRQAALEQADIDLERTRIRSPIQGTVIGRTVDVGQTVAASLQAPELFKIAQDLRRIRIEAQVNEADVGAVGEGNAVAFTVDAYPERKFEGKVTQVRLAATELQNVVTYTVIIEAANDDRRLFPGMTANVQIETAKRDNVLRIANDALRFKPRDQVASAAGAGGGGGSGGGQGTQARAERQERMLEQLRDELQLTDQQMQLLRAEMQKMFAEMRAQRQAQGGGGAAGGAAFGQAAQATQDPAAGIRQRIVKLVESTLEPTLAETQKPLFDRWKRGRENTRAGVIWVLNEAGQPESRSVRFGIADDQFTELVGGPVKEGERIVLRAREAKK